jgi:uncharacterized HhH-GPD family protein
VSTGPARLHLAQDQAADTLLATDPFALLVGMLLDQQFPMERAFAGPYLIAQRLGVDRLDPVVVADADPDAFVSLMTGPPAVHRYPRSMAQRVQELAGFVIRTYGGDASAIWRDVADGRELFARVRALPGFGDQKSRIFVALLGKQFGVCPQGWEQAAGDYATPGRRSVADVVDETTLQEVREYKRALKARGRADAEA